MGYLANKFFKNLEKFFKKTKDFPKNFSNLLDVLKMLDYNFN